MTARDGRVSQLDQVYIRGSMARFFIVPDMLANAPMYVHHSLLITAWDTGRGWTEGGARAEDEPDELAEGRRARGHHPGRVLAGRQGRTADMLSGRPRSCIPFESLWLLEAFLVGLSRDLYTGTHADPPLRFSLPFPHSRFKRIGPNGQSTHPIISTLSDIIMLNPLPSSFSLCSHEGTRYRDSTRTSHHHPSQRYAQASHSHCPCSQQTDLIPLCSSFFSSTRTRRRCRDARRSPPSSLAGSQALSGSGDLINDRRVRIYERDERGKINAIQATHQRRRKYRA